MRARTARVLVVGAGAIGRVVALHLARGGADVCALVKPHQAAAARNGFSVVRRRRVGADELDWVRFADVLTSPAALAAQARSGAASHWDAVFFCVASPALADRAWLEAIAAATGDATVVVLQPGLDDAARVAAAFGADRIVVGAMSLMAWAGDELADTEYWIPPLSSIPLTALDDIDGASASAAAHAAVRATTDAPAHAAVQTAANAATSIEPDERSRALGTLLSATARVRAIASLLSRGGLAARVHDDAGSVAALGAAVLETTAAGLAVAGGRHALARDRALGRLVATAAHDAIAIITAARRASASARRSSASPPARDSRESFGAGDRSNTPRPIPHVGKSGEESVPRGTEPERLVNQVGNHLRSVPHLSSASAFVPRGTETGRRTAAPPIARLFASTAGPLAIDGLLAGLAAIAPVAPDRFFALHYSKLAVQSRETLAAWSARGATLGLATGALDDLRERLADAPAAAVADAAAVAAERRSSARERGAGLDGAAARALAAMRPNLVDAARATALKRNVHELDIASPAADSRESLTARFAESLAATLADPASSFGLISVRRPRARVGSPFAVGDRFTGAFRISAAAAAWGAPPWLRAVFARADRMGILPWLENRLTSDHAELVELRHDATTGTHTMAYRYLAGTPLAGESRYTIAPLADDAGACRLTVTFAFQETTAFAVLLLHGFGIRQHDLAVLAQADAAARRIGAHVAAHTIQSAS